MEEVRKIVETELKCTVRGIAVIGNGASGKVYKVCINRNPYALAVKTSSYPDILKEEYKNICFISERVDCMLPEIYFFKICENTAYLAMKLIKGVQPDFKTLFLRPNKGKLADEIVDNMIKIHSVTNDKFGPVDNPVYNRWIDCYRVIAKDVYDFAFDSGTELPDIVKNAVKTAYENLDFILNSCFEIPTLTHGDYWIPNLIVDTKKMSLAGIIDPFNVMWSEPEYELFTLTVGYGKSLKLYPRYKSKIAVTKKCELKLEMYALINELVWYKKLGKISFDYLKYRSKRFLKEFNRQQKI